MHFQIILFKILTHYLQIHSILAWNPIKSSKVDDLSSGNSDLIRLNHHSPEKRSEEVEILLTEMQKRASISLSENSNPTPSNPSCFYLALSSLPSNSPCEALSRSDSSRIETAASMALCEIKTGLGNIPRECQEWQEGKRGVKVSACIEALARSPQSWSSYSGYLREVVTICSSYRRWEDLETAKQLQSDSAIKISDFVDSLRDFETSRQEREFREAVAKESILSHLTSLSNELGAYNNDLVTQQLQHSDEVTLLHQSLLNSLHSFDSKLSNSVDRELGIVSSSIIQQEKTLQELLASSLNGLTNQLQTDISSVGTSVELRLKESLDLFQPSLQLVVDQLDQLHSGVEKNSALVEEANKVLGSVILGSGSVVETLSESLNVARELLAVQAASLEAHRVQVSNLTERIERLLQSQYNYSFARFFEFITLSNLRWLNGLYGSMKGQIRLRGIIYTIISCFGDLSSPWLANLTVIVATLTSLYPAITLSFRIINLFRRTFKSSYTTRRKQLAPPPVYKPLQIEYYRDSGSTSRVEKRGKRGSRIPSSFWMEEG